MYQYQSCFRKRLNQFVSIKCLYLENIKINRFICFSQFVDVLKKGFLFQIVNIKHKNICSADCLQALIILNLWNHISRVYKVKNSPFCCNRGNYVGNF